MDLFNYLKPIIYKFDPEFCHDMAIFALKHNLVPKFKTRKYDSLKVNLWDMEFSSPIGLAAGFDKNAVATDSIINQGFSFAEVGTVTPHPQSGNPKPRLFRLVEDEAIINRFGFNNKGSEYMLRELVKQKNKNIIGVNIGRNKDSQDVYHDYTFLLKKFYNFASYIVLNISSPNTQDLRNLQFGDQLKQLLELIMTSRIKLITEHQRKVPILIKIAPDLNHEQLTSIAESALNYQIDGIIVTNTTISRNTLHSNKKDESGGLSGKPLFNLSTQILGDIYKLTKGQITLIGSGGVSSGDDAYEKILAGASLIQLYSCLIYQGFGVIEKIKKRLDQLLHQNGYANIQHAVGKNIDTE